VLTAAQCLSRRGWDVVVLERASGPCTQGYMIDFIGPGCDAADAMGILPRLRELGYAVEEAGYYDEPGRRRAVIAFAVGETCPRRQAQFEPGDPLTNV
jgi:2-polyprenyl-6-methoxyphenol hydroxylase-like FAD-dependent oxidoreductase